MSAADFESITGGIAHIVTAGALLVGAAWALYTFRSLLEIPRKRAELQVMEQQVRQGELDGMLAEADIRRSSAELRNLELQNRTQAVVDMTIEARTLSVPGENGRFLAATVNVTNTGNRNTRLILRGQRPFSIRRVTHGPDGEADYEEPPREFAVTRAAMPENTASSIVLRTGATERISFLASIPEPGLYYPAFSIPLTEEDSAVSRETGAERRTYWTAHAFFVAGEDENQAAADAALGGSSR